MHALQHQTTLSGMMKRGCHAPTTTTTTKQQTTGHTKIIWIQFVGCFGWRDGLALLITKSWYCRFKKFFQTEWFTLHVGDSETCKHTTKWKKSSCPFVIARPPQKIGQSLLSNGVVARVDELRLARRADLTLKVAIELGCNVARRINCAHFSQEKGKEIPILFFHSLRVRKRLLVVKDLQMSLGGYLPTAFTVEWTQAPLRVHPVIIIITAVW